MFDAAVRIVEVGPQWLLRKLQPPIVGIVSLQAETFDKRYKNWWLPAHSPTDQGVTRIELNTTHTHIADRCLDAGTQERIVTRETSKDYRPKGAQCEVFLNESNLMHVPMSLWVGAAALDTCKERTKRPEEIDWYRG